MITADIKLNLCDGYEIEGYEERGDKTKIVIRLPECDVELWLPRENCFGDELIQAMPPYRAKQDRQLASR